MSDSRSGGLVSLVGAGPGDPGLITVAGLDRLRRAEVVIYDRLANPALLAEAPPAAERLYVGKAAADHAVPQEAIADLLVARARAGKRVVRLKGGDPFVFGRGGEEALRLAAEGIPFEVVPGVTAAIAVPAYAGIPVTHRAYASSFAVITGQEDADKDERTIDWAGIARGADTLVFLMGWRSLPAIVRELLAHGRAPDTPAAAIRWGTTARQRTVTATLDTLVNAVEQAKLGGPPMVTIVGDVVRLQARLAWFDTQPLFGKRVLVTRTRAQASDMVQQLLREGAEPLELPAIEIVAADPAASHDAVARLRDGGYDWVIFTSANGVGECFRRLDAAGLDARCFAGTRLAVIGAETARALAACGLRADVAPERFIAEALVEALSAEAMQGRRVLLARAAEARSLLPDALRRRGAHVDDVGLYAARRPAQADPDILRRLEAGEVEISTFSASSTVRGCLDLLDGRADLINRTFVACIGPVTAETARDLGLRVDLVSEEHTIVGLIRALRERFTEAARHA